MFSADLSWTDPTDIKVGERKAKKEQSNTPKPSSVKSVKSSKKESSWRPSSRNSGTFSIHTLKPSKSVKVSSKTAVDEVNPVELEQPRRRLSKTPPAPLNLSLKDPSLKDPSLHPAWTISGTLSPRLPSGESFNLPGVLPDPPRTSWSRKSNSSSSRSSKENQIEQISINKVIDEVHEIQQLSPKSFVSRTTRRSTEVCAVERRPVPPVTVQENVKYDRSGSAYSVEIEGCLHLQRPSFTEDNTPDTAVNLRKDSPLDNKISEDAVVPQAQEVAPSASNISPTLVTWKAPYEWDVNLPSASTLDENRLSSATALSVESTNDDLTHFQRFIRRMENAGPRIILDRLREEWHDVDEEADDELRLEKQLWVLTALHLQFLGKSVQSTQDSPQRTMRIPSSSQPIGQKSKILELYGNIAEVYQLSAMQAKEKIYYLSTKPQGSVTLPTNVSYLSVPQAGSVPFPYAASSFNHIRASSLPSLVPSAKLPQVFAECYRLLAPGGVLEIRLMDSGPDRQTAGPKMRMWMEDRVSLNLEKSFRCSRPCMLVPTWVKEAGFSLRETEPASATQTLRIPAAVNTIEGTVDDELSTLVGRALWKDVWGEFVDDVPGEPKWFWEDETIMEECLARKTVFECCTLFAFKE